MKIAAACSSTAARQATAVPPPPRAPPAARPQLRRPAGLAAAAAACNPRSSSSSLQALPRQQLHRMRLLAPAAATPGNGAASAAAAGPEGDGRDPTPEELAEAQAMLKDFMEGMGASGVTSRPQDPNLPEGRLTWAEAVSLVGMAGWRVQGKVCPAIEELAAQLEGCWRGVLPEDQFGLYPLEERYKYLDSLDPEGTQPFSYKGMPDPPKSAPKYPRLQVENRAYWSRAFRKLHLEVAVRQDGLQVLHCVMFPRVTFDLPILSMDLVAMDGRVTLAIVDPCPVTPNLQLPAFYEGPVRELQARYKLESNRSTPEWGQAIFSPLCVIMRPNSGEELGRFLKYTLALNQMHVQIAKIAHPVTSGPNAKRRLAALHAAHQRYCDKQLENDKTRRVLEVAFGAPLAEAYMREVMFDVEPLPADV